MMRNIGRSVLKFQSTRPRGARPKISKKVKLTNCFNPRAHVGRDLLLQLTNKGTSVSIHAPTWGATSNGFAYDRFFQFQSTRPRGARHIIFKLLRMSKKFQSTRPRGARQCSMLRTPHDARFQSTRPRGARQDTHQSSEAHDCFNPRAHVGRDSTAFSFTSTISTFQSTRPRGARPTLQKALVVLMSFNPRAHVGRDHHTANAG